MGKLSQDFHHRNSSRLFFIYSTLLLFRHLFRSKLILCLSRVA